MKFDLTLCVNRKCPSRGKCERWVRQHGEMYRRFKPDRAGRCDHYVLRSIR